MMTSAIASPPDSDVAKRASPSSSGTRIGVITTSLSVTPGSRIGATCAITTDATKRSKTVSCPRLFSHQLHINLNYM